MSALRTAAQQALEALEIGYDSAQAEADQFHAAMAGYKPQRHAAMDADVQKIAAAITALKAALAEPTTEDSSAVEPVAWMVYTLDGKSVCVTDNPADFIEWRSLPLYTAPPQRKPLTEEEIRDLWSWAMTAEAERTATTQQHAFARAIERAHRIGGQQ